MSVGRAQASVEALIADHVAQAFQADKPQPPRPEATATQIRERITDHFQPHKLGTEQDNSPPAILELRNRIIAAFSPGRREDDVLDTPMRLAALRATLEDLRALAPVSRPASEFEQSRTRLLLQREQLVMKNEFTQGFGRIEMWVLSMASLALVLLKDISYLWALPVLAFSVCRSIRLDRQCKRRLKQILEIDALMRDH